MTRNNRILIAAGGVVAMLLIAFYFASPVLAVHSLVDAAKAGDRVALERKVDFPAVRESLKAQLKTAMTRKFEEDPELRDNPFAAFGHLLMASVVDKAVDSFATPEAIANMVATNEPPKTVSTAPGGPVLEPAKPKAKSETKVGYHYEGLDHFCVSYADVRDGERLDLVLKRHGIFGWRLVRIELPGLAKG